ncbi:hypothetical protein ATANTOWER_028672 [Ataeniobius toweri]|uniref:Peptidase M12B propeptide domain-containing protein n=1 Tax=Ataeniobius toweri TaxID=208326 RepID=A0ABU7BP46_9TELE|nr:hypothetical protein [Ataeniobius toweri]
MIYVKFFLLLCCLKDIIGQFGNPLNKYIRHYEGLSYDTEALHSRHQRAKRALHPEDRTVHLDFHTHGRHFNLRLKRDIKLFSPDLVVEVSGKQEPIDTSHIYSGEIFGKAICFLTSVPIYSLFKGYCLSSSLNYLF